MRKNLLTKIPIGLLIKTAILVFVFTGYKKVQGQTGYIYLHKNATDENSSPVFTFNVTGSNGFNKSYNLNDQHPNFNVHDIGATGNGSLFALAGNDLGNNNYGIYYKAADASTWVSLGGGANRIDGGPNNTHIHSNTFGETFYYSGTSFNSLGGTNARDVAFDKSGTNRVFYVNSSGQVYYRNATSGSWTLAGLNTQRIDVAPNGSLVSTGNAGYNTVFISNFNSTGAISLGSPTGATVTDVAVGDDGVIYALSGGIVYRYTGGYSSGGSWIGEPISLTAYDITGGNGGQMWASAGAGAPGMGGQPNTIWSRIHTGSWIDDESIRPNLNSNCVLIPVTPGTYTVNEVNTLGWSLGKIDVHDPTNNTTTDLATRTSSVNVAAGEVVHLMYRNFLVQSFSVVNDCSGSAYVENFGTGNTSSLGAPLTGQTNYHYIGSAPLLMNDGYYMVASRSSQADPVFTPSSFGDYPDHTTGDGLGRMMLVNASYEKGEFFRRHFTGLLPGTHYSFSAWVMNLNNSSIKPNVRFEINDPTTQTSLSTLNTGDITTVGVWTQYQLQFTATQSEVDLVLRNNNVGGGGNDLALDDIRFGLAQPNQPVVAVVDASCSAGGSIQVSSPTGASIEYSIGGATYQSSPVFTNVAAGTYSIKARYVNSLGCTSTATTVTINPANCPATCTSGTLSTYTLNPANTISANAYAANGGTANLVYQLTNGSSVPGLGNSFTVPLTYSDLNNTATGVDNQWYGFSSLTLDGKTYFVLQPKTDPNPGGLYTGLPANNQQQELYTSPGSTDNFFTTHIQNGNLDVLGNFTFSFGNFPALPAGVTIYQQELTLRQTGNVETTGNGYNQGGFWQKPVNQTAVNQAENSRTPEFSANVGQSYTYQYSAFSDGTSFPTNVPNYRGAGIYGSLTVCYVDPALPVSLLRFAAQVQENKNVRLTWTTAQERNNKSFILERSKDLVAFEEVGRVNDVAGNSTTRSDYQFTDVNPYLGTSYYRLTQVDRDEKKETFKAVSVVVDGKYTAFPNPVTQNKITLELDEPSNAVIKLTQVDGKEIRTTRVVLTGRSVQVTPEDKLNAGVYLLTVKERAVTRSYKLIIP